MFSCWLSWHSLAEEHVFSNSLSTALQLTGCPVARQTLLASSESAAESLWLGFESSFSVASSGRPRAWCEQHWLAKAVLSARQFRHPLRLQEARLLRRGCDEQQRPVRSTALWFEEVLERCPKGVDVHVPIFSNQLLLIFPRNQSSFIGKKYGGIFSIDVFLMQQLRSALAFWPLVLQRTQKPVLIQSGLCLTFANVLVFFLSPLWNNLLLASSMTKATHQSPLSTGEPQLGQDNVHI